MGIPSKNRKIFVYCIIYRVKIQPFRKTWEMPKKERCFAQKAMEKAADAFVKCYERLTRKALFLGLFLTIDFGKMQSYNDNQGCRARDVFCSSITSKGGAEHDLCHEKNRHV